MLFVGRTKKEQEMKPKEKRKRRSGNVMYSDEAERAGEQALKGIFNKKEQL